MTGLNPMSGGNLIDETILAPEEQEWVKGQAEAVAERFGINPDSPQAKISEKQRAIRQYILEALNEDSALGKEYGGVFDKATLTPKKKIAVVEGVTNLALSIKIAEGEIIENLVAIDRAKVSDKEKEKFVYSLAMPDRKAEAKKGQYSKDIAEEKAVKMKLTMLDNQDKKRVLQNSPDDLTASKKAVRDTVGYINALQNDIDQLSKEVLALEGKMSSIERDINRIADLELISQEDSASAKSGFFGRIKGWYKNFRQNSAAKKVEKNTEQVFREQLELQSLMVKSIQDINNYVRDNGDSADEIDDDVEEINEVHNGDLDYTNLIDRQNVLRLRFAKLVQGTENMARLKKQQREKHVEDLDTLKRTHKEHEDRKESISEDLKKEMQFPAERRRIFYAKFADRLTYIRSMRESLHKVAAYGEIRRKSRIDTISKLYFELRAEVLKFESVTGVNGFIEILDTELGSIKISNALTNTRVKVAIDDLEQVQKALALIAGGRKMRSKSLDKASRVINKAKKVQLADIAATQADVDDGSEPEPEAVPAPKMDNDSLLPEQPKVKVKVGDTSLEPQTIADDPLAVQPQVRATFGGFGDLSYQGFGSFINIVPLPVQPAVKAKVESDSTGTSNKGETPLPEQPKVKAKVEDVKSDAKESSSTEKSAEKREARESKEILRQAETLYIGDLNGSYAAFVKNMTALKAMRVENPAPGVDRVIWTGGDRKVVFLGDFLADRTPEGFKIALAIADLLEQAREQGGAIQILYGNHEDFMTSFLLDKQMLGVPGSTNRFALFKNALINGEQAYGMLEPLRLFTERGKKFAGTMEEFKNDLQKEVTMNAAGFNLINSLADEALASMRKPENKEGRKILEQISRMKLMVVDDVNLVLHTELTTDILTDLVGSANGPKNMAELKSVIKVLNDEFQGLLRELLLEESTSDRTEKLEQLKKLTEVYADSDNRSFDSSNPQNAALLKKLADIGVKSVINGHSFNGGKPVSTTGVGIDLINLDFGVGHPAYNVADEDRSVGYFGKDRKFRLGAEEAKELTEHRYNNKVVIKLVNWLEDIFSLTDKPKHKLAVQIAEDMAINSHGKPQSAEDLEKFVDDVVGYADLSKVMWYLAGESVSGTGFKPRARLTLNAESIREAYWAADYLLSRKPELSLEQIREVLANVSFRSESFEQMADKYIRQRRAKAKEEKRKAAEAVKPEVKVEAVAEEKKEEKPAAKPVEVAEKLETSDAVKRYQDLFKNVLKKTDISAALLASALASYSEKNKEKAEALVANMQKYPDVFTFIFAGEHDGIGFATKKMKPVAVGESTSVPEMILENLLKYGLDVAKLTAKQTEIEELKIAAGGALTAGIIQKYIKDIYSGNLISFARDRK